MKKIAFLVEKEFFKKHIGVRNYFMNIYKLISLDNDTNLIEIDDENESSLRLRKVFFQDENLLKNNFISRDICLEGNPKDVFYSYLKSMRDINQVRPYYIEISNFFLEEKYDYVFITAPWLNINSIIPTRSKLIGIVYDLIPNEYVFCKNNKPILFAAQHNRGYSFYEKYCNYILCPSKLVSEIFKKYYSISQSTILTIPLSLPYAYIDYTPNFFLEKDGITLASPFDPRKGLHIIPKIINKIHNNFNTLYIYGDRRCSLDDMYSFFNILQCKKIVWFPWATFENIKYCFAKSKFLLFPSLNEGLGIPIMESQASGTPVITRNIAPMNTLLCGDSLLIDDFDSQIDLINNFFEKNINYEFISKEAFKRFSNSNIKNFFDKILL